MSQTSRDWTVFDGSQPGAVYPLESCPHISEYLSEFDEKGLSTRDPCHACDDVSENWLCLCCGTSSCSRWVKGHALEHFDRTTHALALSLSDFAVWCYPCDSYVRNSAFDRVLQAAYEDKHGNLTEN